MKLINWNRDDSQLKVVEKKAKEFHDELRPQWPIPMDLGLSTTSETMEWVVPQSLKVMCVLTCRRRRSCLSFLSLPGEIRNHIYHLVLPSGDFSIVDLHPAEYASEEKAKGITRSKYTIRDHTPVTCLRNAWSIDWSLCTFSKTKRKKVKTTYGRHRFRGESIFDLSIMSINRQTRAEMVSIFYGSNFFSFFSMAALARFVKDRTYTSLQNLRQIRLILSIETGPVQQIRNLAWSKAFKSLSQFPRLALEHLDIQINSHGIHHQKPPLLHLENLDWVYDLASNIYNLDYLSIGLDSPYVNGEDLLWRFLGLVMLRPSDGKRSDVDSLKNRSTRQVWKWPEHPLMPDVRFIWMQVHQ